MEISVYRKVKAACLGSLSESLLQLSERKPQGSPRAQALKSSGYAEDTLEMHYQVLSGE